MNDITRGHLRLTCRKKGLRKRRLHCRYHKPRRLCHKCCRGPRGYRGLRGLRGYRGPRGYHGPKGDKGDKGDQGNNGDPGPKGDKGDQGNNGNPGSKGDKGDPGPKGDTGPQGPSGGCACPCNGSLLQNPSFDDYIKGTSLTFPAHWSTTLTAADVQPPSTDDEIHSGLGSVVFKFTGGRRQGDIYQDVAATPKCCYNLQFWAKGTNASTGLTAEVSFLNGGSVITETHSLSVLAGSLDQSSWISYLIATPPAPSSTATVRVRLVVQGNSTSMRLDDAVLTVGGCGG